MRVAGPSFGVLSTTERVRVSQMKSLPQHSLSMGASGPPLRSYYEAKAFDFLAALVRRRLIIIAITIAAVSLALCAIPFMAKQYTADALIQLDLNQLRPPTAAGVPNVALDPAAMVESEARIIRSRTIARRVVIELELASRPTKKPSGQLEGLIRSITERLPVVWSERQAAVSDADNMSPEQAIDASVLEVMQGLEVRNDLRSYLITIAYTSNSPASAAQLANGFAEQYLESRIEASFANARRTSDWLHDQIAAEQAALRRADLAVQEFREAHGLLEAAPQGVSIEQQKLLDLNAQINTATALLSTQAARLERTKSMIDGGNIPPASDLAGSPIIQELITSDITAKREVAKLTNDLGQKHPLVAQAEANLREAESRLWEEVKKTVAVIESEHAATATTKRDLERRAAELQTRMIETKAREQDLRNLQENADGVRTRLQGLIREQEQAAALAELKPVTAELVMPAESIAIASSPNPKTIVLMALFGGLLASAGVVYLLERRDTGFRTDVHVDGEIGVHCVGMVPHLPKNATASERIAFREAARAVLATGIDGSANQQNVVMITSALPGEGKTVLAYALAGCIMSSGRSVIILNVGSPPERVHPPLSARVMLRLDEVLSDRGKLGSLSTDAAHSSQPVVIQCASACKDIDDVFSSAAFETMLSQAKALYDVVLIEAPATLLFADALVLGRRADVILHAIRWNHTQRHTVASALRRLSGVALQVHATVLTQVDPKAHRKYSIFDEIYYRRKYADYFINTPDTPMAENL